MEELDYEFTNGDITVRVMKDHTYHVTCPAIPDSITSKCRPFEFYYLIEHGEQCNIYLNLYRGCYVVFLAGILQKSGIKTIGEAREFAQNIRVPAPLESPCTLATLKRDAATPGFTLTKLNSVNTVPRTIKKVQSNAIVLNVPGKPSRESCLELPSASLIEYNRKELRIYLPGQRLFNLEEITALKRWESMRDIEAEKIDAISDSSSQYYRQKRYWENIGMSYMFSSQKEKGLLRDLNKNLISDTHIRGELLLEYKVDMPMQ